MRVAVMQGEMRRRRAGSHVGRGDRRGARWRGGETAPRLRRHAALDWTLGLLSQRSVAIRIGEALRTTSPAVLFFFCLLLLLLFVSTCHLQVE